MAAIAIKRVYDGRASTDGMRILVDRLWPRGVSKDAAALDLWAKEIAPSPSLRTWFDHREDRFAEFKERYLLELSSNPAVPDLVGRIGKRKATLLYGAKDPAINHAIVLTGYLGATVHEENSDVPGSRHLSHSREIAASFYNTTMNHFLGFDLIIEREAMRLSVLCRRPELSILK